MKRQWLYASTLLAAAGLAGGCGYALVGRGTVVDPSIKKIGVPMFVNGTGKALLDQKVTQRVIEAYCRMVDYDFVAQYLKRLER